MMIGALKPPLRSDRTTSRPSVSGRPTSISTRSGALALAALAPLAPVSTADASNSSCNDNCSTKVSRRSVSSSTIRILRALAMCTSLKRPAERSCACSRELAKFRTVLGAFPGSFLLQVGNHYRFTSREALYSKFRGRFDECPVMKPELAERSYQSPIAHEKESFFNGL